jgi:hypothetical protein
MKPNRPIVIFSPYPPPDLTWLQLAVQTAFVRAHRSLPMTQNPLHSAHSPPC